MTYNPKNQYRCTIIRGRAQNELDDLLPAYARIIKHITPCHKEDFPGLFNKALSPYLGSPTKKTLNNHRTEIAGKLFGMWIEDNDRTIRPSQRTEILLKTGDNPAFFKDMIAKLQFPNGMDKPQTVKERIINRISIRPCAYVLKLLLAARDLKITLTKNEIGYYVLNNLDVLQRKVSVNEVMSAIVDGRREGVFVRVEHKGKISSFSMQHISELLNLMELANLIRTANDGHNKLIALNDGEMKTIEYLASKWNNPPEFDVYKYDFEDLKSKKRFYSEWSGYFSNSDPEVGSFTTSVSSLIPAAAIPEFTGVDTGELGDDGELLVFEREKARVRQFNERLANKVIYQGKQRGLGYDIQSIKADRTRESEHAIFIEVKSTKRVTAPCDKFKDSFDLTRNEWVAAEQYAANYFIYRIYITNEGIKAFVMQDPVQLKSRSAIFAEPLKYHVEFDEKAGKLQQW